MLTDVTVRDMATIEPAITVPSRAAAAVLATRCELFDILSSVMDSEYYKFIPLIKFRPILFLARSLQLSASSLLFISSLYTLRKAYLVSC